jgi:hypothetical protein
MSGKVVEGGSCIPVIDEKPDCVCDDQGPYANSKEVGVNDFMELGHTLCSIWADRGSKRRWSPSAQVPRSDLGVEGIQRRRRGLRAAGVNW